MSKPAKMVLISAAAILPIVLALVHRAGGSEPRVSPQKPVAKVAAPRPLAGPTPILDRATGKVVGYKDPRTGNLVFTTRNRVIRAARIQRVSKAELLSQMRRYGCGASSISDRQLKKLSNAARMAEAAWAEFDRRTTDPNDDWYSGGTGGDKDACVDLCWVMAEGGAKCEGCCKPVGDGFCACWESCTDYMSSLER